MKKIVASLVLLSVTTAFAGPIEQSTNMSSNVSKKALNASGTSVRFVVKTAKGAFALSAEAASEAGEAIGEGTVFIIDNASAASTSVAKSAGDSSQYVVTKTGKLLRMTMKHGKIMLSDSAASTSKAARSVHRGIEVTISASGQVLDKTGRIMMDAISFMGNKAGEAAELVLDGSGQVLKVTEGALVVVVNTSGAVLTQVGKGSSKSMELSGEAAKALLYDMPSNAFRALVDSGKQY